jgi:hypothetical protein
MGCSGVAYQLKLKDWRDAKKKPSLSKKDNRNGNAKPGISEILHSSKISLHDANAEGVVAMEQRIQQLTQSLSRVGRVLDRHREGCSSLNGSADSMRKRVHSPLRILADKEVVDWMWNSPDGIASTLMRSVNASRCVRPVLIHKLSAVRDKFASLATVEVSKCGSQPRSRGQLTDALLEMRNVLTSELTMMAKVYRSFAKQSNEDCADDNSSQASSQIDVSEDEINDRIESVAPSVSLENTNLVARELPIPGSENAEAVTSPLLDGLAQQMDESAGGCTSATGSQPNVVGVYSSRIKAPSLKTSPWLEFYAERLTLHAAADLLLLYARTGTFFALQEYRSLESTPIEVYARELGNAVPLSVIDKGLASGDSSGPTAVAVGLTLMKESDGSLHEDGFSSTEDLAALKYHHSELCAPDDIVAKVSVRYEGDYVLSQLLQWYNAGIGQKPGLPDLMGCTLLSKIADCFASELLKSSRLKADRKTTYESKVRPRLVEWMQDPYQRGNSWPKEIRRAFTGEKAGAQVQDACRFGSPIIDFLVTGDESNITAVLNELDADDKITAKTSGYDFLASVDKGRPAQAVSTWVQCESPGCLKWRKIPWHADADLLPEKFFCKDNKWNPAAASCDAPEDDWDAGDALVGSDGKVEGSPVKRRADETLDVNDEASFRIGSKFPNF